ncbi:IclR family transcriptional regulator [Hirschia baltica]|uniref:Transcriptional regulator, IclR family n=1 Tax=Hirschia baltica (strain ATCC 49814 / DSM 5838 / IFAM 1418) TaxID=582402 RepID=C6XQC8_HIRBI|nr:IclR family transcriptional regulator [Hirschia baltica]ACT60427.1 transcriptional regulator, IclR family [Hirschia baltica ATCC 49814]
MAKIEKKTKQSDAAPPEKTTSGAQTLMRGLDVLEAVRDGEVTLKELSERLGLTRSTAHRLATALVERRFLSFTPRGGYSLGSVILALGSYARDQIEFAHVARPILENLAKETEDTVHFGVFDGKSVLYLEKVPGRRRVVISSHVGERQPITTTGLGKALILEETEEAWEEMYASENDEYSSTLPVWLERMRNYSKGDYAFDLEENEDRVRCVSAPVRDVENKIVAAVSVSSAAQYMDDERMQSLIPVVQEATRQISRELGWRDPVN